MRSSASPSRVLPSGWLLASEPGPGGRTASAAGETTCARTLPDRHQCRVDEEDRPAGGRDARGLEGILRRAAQRDAPWCGPDHLLRAETWCDVDVRYRTLAEQCRRPAFL